MSYSIKEAAWKLAVSEITLRRVITKGGIGYHRIGKMYRLTEEDIRLYIQSTEKSKTDGAVETLSPENLSLNGEIIKRIENETAGLRHGIVRFALHIVDGKPVRYTVSREQTVLWDGSGDHLFEQPENGKGLERVEKE